MLWISFRLDGLHDGKTARLSGRYRLAIRGGLSQYPPVSGRDESRLRKRAVTIAQCQVPGSSVPVDREISLYTTMLRLRRFEEKAGMLYAMGTLARPCPLGFGQEGAIVAIVDSLQPTDLLWSLQSRPGLELALGALPSQVFQQLMPAENLADAHPTLLRGPGEAFRILSRQDAGLAIGASRAATRVILAFEAGDLTPYLADHPRDRVLVVLIVPVDRRPEIWPLPAHIHVRDCDGAHVDAVMAALAAAREALAASEAPIVLAILTPAYAGHTRETARRAPNRRDASDAIALYRQHLVTTGRLSDLDASALEAAVRDEIAAAGRTISRACAS